jgi:MFS family permease
MDERTMYSGYRWLMLLVSCFVFMSYTIDMIAYAPIFGEIAKELNVDMGAAVKLAMAFAITLASAMIFGGVACDKYGITVVFVLGLLCASVPATLMPWIGHSYEIVFLSRLVQGLVGITFAAVGPILVLWFPPKEQGLAGGLMMCSLFIGPAIGVVASPAVFEVVTSWQKAVAFLSIPGWITIVLALLVTRRSPSPQVVNALAEAMKSDQGKVTYWKAISSPITWIGTSILFLNTWGLYGLLNLVPPYLATEAPMGLGLGPMVSGKISLALTLIGIPAFVVGGIFFDKVAKRRARPAVFISFIMMGIFTYLLLFSFVYNNLILLVICLMIAGWGVAFVGPSLSGFIAMNYPPNIVGGMVGWWFGFGIFGGAVGTYWAGLSIAKFGNFYWALIPISIAAGIGIILGFFLKSK